MTGDFRVIQSGGIRQADDVGLNDSKVETSVTSDRQAEDMAQKITASRYSGELTPNEEKNAGGFLDALYTSIAPNKQLIISDLNERVGLALLDDLGINVAILKNIQTDNPTGQRNALTDLNKWLGVGSVPAITVKDIEDILKYNKSGLALLATLIYNKLPPDAARFDSPTPIPKREKVARYVPTTISPPMQAPPPEIRKMTTVTAAPKEAKPKQSLLIENPTVDPPSKLRIPEPKKIEQKLVPVEIPKVIPHPEPLKPLEAPKQAHIESAKQPAKGLVQTDLQAAQKMVEDLAGKIADKSGIGPLFEEQLTAIKMGKPLPERQFGNKNYPERYAVQQSYARFLKAKKENDEANIPRLTNELLLALEKAGGIMSESSTPEGKPAKATHEESKKDSPNVNYSLVKECAQRVLNMTKKSSLFNALLRAIIENKPFPEKRFGPTNHPERFDVQQSYVRYWKAKNNKDKPNIQRATSDLLLALKKVEAAMSAKPMHPTPVDAPRKSTTPVVPAKPLRETIEPLFLRPSEKYKKITPYIPTETQKLFRNLKPKQPLPPAPKVAPKEPEASKFTTFLNTAANAVKSVVGAFVTVEKMISSNVLMKKGSGIGIEEHNKVLIAKFLDVFGLEFKHIEQIQRLMAAGNSDYKGSSENGTMYRVANSLGSLDIVFDVDPQKGITYKEINAIVDGDKRAVKLLAALAQNAKTDKGHKGGDPLPLGPARRLAAELVSRGCTTPFKEWLIAIQKGEAPPARYGSMSLYKNDVQNAYLEYRKALSPEQKETTAKRLLAALYETAANDYSPN